MKKLYSFLTLMLLFLVSSATASADVVPSGTVDEVKWDVSESYVTEITDGMHIVLQQGTYAGWSTSGYLNPSGTYKSEADATCVYEVNVVGTAANDGSTLYVLKNMTSGQYLGTDGETLSYKDAFQCSILRAYFDTDNKRQAMAAASRGSRQQESSDGAAWVLASAEPDEDGDYNYLCYFGCPAFASYQDTNDWFLYEATARQKTVEEKLEELYNEVFPDGFNEELLVVGSQPSNISQEAFDALQAAYETAANIMGTNASDEELFAAIEQLQAAYDLYQSSLVKIVPGKYYQFLSQRSSDALYDNGSALLCKSNFSVSDPATIDEVKYIWLVEDAGDDLFYLKNFGTGRYMGSQSTTSSQFPTTATASTRVSIAYNDNLFFLLGDESGNLAHCAGGYSVVKWQDKNAQGNQWKVTEIPADQIAALAETVEKNNFIASLYDLLSEAKATQTRYVYNSGITFDDQYNAEGLFTTMTGNHTESTEGSIAAAFDGDLTSYYHTNWSSSAAFDDYDWVEFDLGKDIQNAYLKVTQRHNNRNGNPSKIFLVAPAADDDLAGAWTDTVYNDTLIYQYTTNYPAGAIDSTTAVLQLDFDHAVSKLRFGVKATKANQKFGGIGPCWHLAEIRMYENDGENPRYALIPDAVKEALAAQIANAENKLSDSTCVQSDYDDLQAAIDAFVAAYPDDSRLSSLIKEAEEQAAAEGLTGTQLGYFPAGAQETLANEVAAVKTAIEGKVLTLDQIDEYLTTVRRSIADYKAKLIIPEDGAYIRFKSESVDESGDATSAYGNYIYATNADTIANLKWGYKGDDNAETRCNAIWQVQKQSDGTVAFRNLATGRYISNLYTGVADADEVSLSQQFKSGNSIDAFTFASAKEGGKFVIELTEGIYFNTAPGGAIVNWSASTGNSVFSVEVVDADDIYTHTQDVKAGSLQIVSVPFNATGIAPTAYKVLGQKVADDGFSYLQLAPYDDDETIPANTPFIIQTEDGEDFAQITLADFDDLDNITYNYEPVNQNGMVSTVGALTVKAGVGLLLDDVVKISVDGTSVAAGTGYFLDIPATTEDGELTVKLEDVINGISQAVVVSNTAADVYTLSGVKVRSNVSTSNATNGLPAGLYIVGGKKVIVK